VWQGLHLTISLQVIGGLHDVTNIRVALQSIPDLVYYVYIHSYDDLMNTFLYTGSNKAVWTIRFWSNDYDS
jgi:hypothetical protein